MSSDTASALERLFACPSSAVLSPVVREDSVWALRGRFIHGFIRAVAAGEDREAALLRIPKEDWRETCAGIDFAKLCGGVLRLRAEAAYRLNVDTDDVTFLGLNIGRRYPARPNAPLDEFVDGTNDFEGFRFDGVPIVGDAKSGWNLVTPCKDNPQMRFHARTQMLAHDADRVEARIAYVRDDGSTFFDRHEFTRFELDTFGDELVDMKAQIRRAHALLTATTNPRLEVSAGDHCRYCPAQTSCPRFTALARNLLPELRTIEGQLGAMTLEQRSRAWTIADEAHDLLEMVRTSLRELARQEPIPLPGGKLLKEGKSSTSSFDKSRALTMLREHGVSEDEIKGLTTSTPTKPVSVVNDPSIVRPRAARTRKSAA